MTLGRVTVLFMAAALVGCAASETRDRQDEKADNSPLPAQAQAGENQRSRPLTRAVWVGGRLWLLDDVGGLSSLAEGDAQRRTELPGERVADICRHEGRLLVLAGAPDSGDEWQLRARRGDQWSLVTRIKRRDDRVLGLGCNAPVPTVLTNKRIIEAGSGPPQVRQLSVELESQGTLAGALHVMGRSLYVGFNLGEWGGGLSRIDLRSGRVETIERNVSGELCGGPLNTNCDPVHAIVETPGRSGCVTLAIGLEHMRSHGRLADLCGSIVERRFFKPMPSPNNEKLDASGEPFSTIAFHGVIASGGNLVALGRDGLYRFAAAGQPSMTPFPRSFPNIGGVFADFSQPDLIVVLTETHDLEQALSSTPLLISR